MKQIMRRLINTFCSGNADCIISCYIYNLALNQINKHLQNTLNIVSYLYMSKKTMLDLWQIYIQFVKVKIEPPFSLFKDLIRYNLKPPMARGKSDKYFALDSRFRKTCNSFSR